MDIGSIKRIDIKVIGDTRGGIGNIEEVMTRYIEMHIEQIAVMAVPQITGGCIKLFYAVLGMRKLVREDTTEIRNRHKPHVENEGREEVLVS